MSSICINVAAKVAVNRPAAVMHSRLVRTAAADGKVKPTTAIIAAYHFRFERKLVEVEPRHFATLDLGANASGNPVNSLRFEYNRVP